MCRKYCLSRKSILESPMLTLVTVFTVLYETIQQDQPSQCIKMRPANRLLRRRCIPNELTASANENMYRNLNDVSLACVVFAEVDQTLIGLFICCKLFQKNKKKQSDSFLKINKT